MTQTLTPLSALSRCMVYAAEDLCVETGALMGDAIGGLGDVVPGDIYLLNHRATARELVLSRMGTVLTVAVGSSVGLPSQTVTPLARHQLMSELGASVEILVMEVEGERLVMPLGPLSATDEYSLLSSEAVAGELGSVAFVSFTRGTKITMGNGMQVPVEELTEGDRVLTRDHGVQPIQWTGQQTVRAEGANAPVVIQKGALNNADDLILSPDHRLFIYQRRDEIGAGRAELLIRARHLVNGETIWRDTGGHVDYFHLLFASHEIIYVEGIPAESLLVSPDVLAGLDDDLAMDVSRRMDGRTHVPHFGVEPSAADLDGFFDAAAILRRASSR